MTYDLRFMNAKNITLTFVLIIFCSQTAFGQVDYEVSELPCVTVATAPDYLPAFLTWVFFQEDKRTITVSSAEKQDSLLLSIQFNSFHLSELNGLINTAERKKYSGKISGSLNVKGTCATPKISGGLRVSKGYAELSNFGRQSFEDVVIDTTGIAHILNRFDSLRVDVNIRIADNSTIRNKRFLPLKVKLKGKLNLSKAPGQDLRLTGKLKAVEGFAKPLGERFNLIEGVLTYFGPINDPKIYFKSLYQPHQEKQDVKIWHLIEGTVENPVFKFSSDPPMEPKNIISYTLFGQPFYRLGSIEQNLVRSVTTRSTADRTAEVFLNRMKTIATQKLSVDVVKIDNTTAESGTVVTTGWYINPKVFFAIQNIIAGKPRIGFYLEYYLSENLKLILSQDNDYGQGIDLQYEYNY